MIAMAEQRNHAKSLLKKAEEHLASAESQPCRHAVHPGGWC
jgi:hypothetical protein